MKKRIEKLEEGMSTVEIERIRGGLKQVREETDRLSNEEFDNALIALLEKRYDVPISMQCGFGLMARMYQLDPKFREGLDGIANEQLERLRQDILIIK
ncbi:MAG: hypothetical protein ACM3SR_08030 [Ignavibacteriales bacterium]